MTETAQMRTWAEISLDRLAHNYQTLRAMLAPDCRFLGLCKANAYGHGALQVGRKLEALGADMLAVACVDEAGGAAPRRRDHPHPVPGADAAPAGRAAAGA